jgi:hypothetical protein
MDKLTIMAIVALLKMGLKLPFCKISFRGDLQT